MPLQRGFTLIELMIVVLIIAIIVGFAYPAYTDKVRQTHRADGTTALNHATMVMESCRADLATYTGCNTRVAAQSDEGYYTIAITVAAAGNSYSLTATAVGSQAKDARCTTLTLNSQGTEGYTGTATSADTCWGT